MMKEELIENHKQREAIWREQELNYKENLDIKRELIQKYKEKISTLEDKIESNREGHKKEVGKLSREIQKRNGVIEYLERKELWKKKTMT